MCRTLLPVVKKVLVVPLLLGRLNPDGFFLAPRKAREGEGRRPPCRYEATAPPRRPQKLAWVKVGARASRRSVNTMKEACRILLDEETMAWGLPAHAQMHVYCLGQVVWCCGGTVKGRKRVVVAGRQGGVSSLLQVVPWCCTVKTKRGFPTRSLGVSRSSSCMCCDVMWGFCGCVSIWACWD